jgi:hypothetical protein
VCGGRSGFGAWSLVKICRQFVDVNVEFCVSGKFGIFCLVVLVSFDPLDF